jgi:hypothetical protein
MGKSKGPSESKPLMVVRSWLTGSRAQRCVTLLLPLTSNSSTGFDGRIQPPSVKLVDRGPMQNLAYSPWTHPGTGPLPIGRIRKLAILAGRVGGFSWSLLTGCRFSTVGVVVGAAAAAAALGLWGHEGFGVSKVRLASHSLRRLHS